MRFLWLAPFNGLDLQGSRSGEQADLAFEKNRMEKWQTGESGGMNAAKFGSVTVGFGPIRGKSTRSEDPPEGGVDTGDSW